MQFKFDKLPDEEIVKKIEESLKKALVEEDISKITRAGKTITIEGDVPRRFVKFLVKKFLGQTQYKNLTRIISTKPEIFEVFYYQPDTK
jgi:hypothetical protein